MSVRDSLIGGVAPLDARVRPIYLLGYGNPGRADDGLGPLVADKLEKNIGVSARVETAIQPGLEHCPALSLAEEVFFVDASRTGPAPFSLARLTPDDSAPAFSLHLFGPRELLAVCRAAYGRQPVAWLVAVRGYRFAAGGTMSGRAQWNAACAAAFLRDLVRGRGGEAHAGE